MSSGAGALLARDCFGTTHEERMGLFGLFPVSEAVHSHGQESSNGATVRRQKQVSNQGFIVTDAQAVHFVSYKKDTNITGDSLKH